MEPEPITDAEGLFGAATPGTFDPVPVVNLDGTDIASGTTGGAVAGLIVVDGLEFTWGREEVLDQPDPATGTLELFDPSGTWATSSDLRGKGVTIGYDSGGVRKVIFRGRVGGPVQIRRKTIVVDNVPVDGALVTMPLVSLLLDLANIRPTAAWPEETVEERRARIEDDASDVVDGITVRDYWKPPKVPAVAAKDQSSLLQHLVDLYDSTGADRLNYLPDSNTVTYFQRRDLFSVRGTGRLWWETVTGPRAGKGLFIRAEGYVSGAPAVHLGLDSAALEYDPGDGITQPERLTRVELVHPSSDPAWAYADRTVTRLVSGQNEKRSGVRTVRMESQLLWNNYADTAASDLEDMTQKEAAAWRMEPIVLRTRPVGGFETSEHADLFLLGAESVKLLFLQRSWLPSFGLRPVVGIMGATITYRNQGWEVAFIPAPITTTLPQHAITWEEIDDGTSGYEVQWHDGDHPSGMHESLTLDDLGHAARPLGVSPSIGADTGWDEYQ